jgi:hypothetical protein
MPDVMWQRSNECVGGQVEDALVLLELNAGMYFALNGTAAHVWEFMAEPSTEADLVDALVRKYKVAPEDCARSVRALLKELSMKGLAKVVG